MFRELNIFTGNAYPALAEDVCGYLGAQLGRAEVFEFSNENIFVRVMDNVRERDVFIIQPLSTPVNKSIVELLIMIDTMKRASAGRITAVVPYYAYARSDKKDQPRVPITARLLADLITVAGASRLLTIDLHAGQIQGFFNIPVDELSALSVLSGYFREKNLTDLVVATDLGFAKRGRNFAARLDAPLAIIEKRRLGNSGSAEVMRVVGDVAGKRVLFVDDEIDRAGTLMEAIGALKEAGATEFYACCTHPILSGPAVERIANSDIIELVVADTVSIPESKRISKIRVISIAPLLGEAIHRIHTGLSIGAMFE